MYTPSNTFFKDTLTISIIAFRPATGVSCRRGDPVMAPAAEGLPRDINLHTLVMAFLSLYFTFHRTIVSVPPVVH